MTHLLVLPRYDPSGASSRVRFYQYYPFLESNGFQIETQVLLDAEYMSRLLAGQSRSLNNLLKCYSRRLRCLLSHTSADLIWLEKELLPWAPVFLDPGLLRSVPYVVDYDDAIFHNYDEHRWPLLRALYRHKIPAVMRRAAVVVAGNNYLADFAQRSGAQRVELVPSVVDGAVYRPVSNDGRRGFTVGWVGSPSTQKFLELVRETLESIIDPATDRFVTVGARYDQPLFPGHEPLQWNLATEPALLASFDVGIMPLPDAPFERGKCGFKLVQYMACGTPMVASPVGVNQTMVRPGITGYLAESVDEWRHALLTLKSDAALRQRMGVAARKDFEERYSFAINAPKLATILHSAGASRHAQASP